ncbi:superoxide dismutase family protein [Consotaella aegiceratis]|uniref:superoxide dismutase family protein n=1 Tax=Consotaella aegiceratis TaxID=3097961 RepID=UPI002F411843
MKTIAMAALAACCATTAFAQDPASPETVSVEMKMQDGTGVGTITLMQTPNGVLLSNDLSGLPDGEHAIHLHETGACEGDFSSAGGHYNPTSMEHGYKSEGGVHAGDMPNFTAVNGIAKFDHVDPNVSLVDGDAPLNDADGTAIIIHDGADDYESQPSGDAGSRLACGVVYPAQ